MPTPKVSKNIMPRLVPSPDFNSDIKKGWLCGPLSMAIVARSTEKVRKILANHPKSLEECNLVEQTPFHLAARSSPCLSLLLEALHPADYHLLDQGDARGDNALVYAMAFSLANCRNRESKRKCRRCTCTSPLVMLLKTKACSLPMKSILRGVFHIHVSLRCKIRFINHLKRRGEILKKLAMGSPFWTNADADFCNPHSVDVLDAHANSVIKILEGHGVRIPNSLKSRDCVTGSVYHFIRDAADAERFYRRGFRDVAVSDNRGFVPLEMAGLPPSYQYWLLEHGTPLSSVSPRSNLGNTASTMDDDKAVGSQKRPHAFQIACGVGSSHCGLDGGRASAPHNRTHAHAIAFSTANFLTHKLKDLYADGLRNEISAIKRLSTAIVPAEFIDDCNCPCSDRGCIPWTDMIKGLCSDETIYNTCERRCVEMQYEQFRVDSVPILAERFCNFLRTTNKIPDPRRLRAAIRFLTFTGLGMTHVCCRPCVRFLDRRPEFHRVHSGEEALEIRELEATELHVMKDLVTEFSEKLDIQSGSCSMNLTALEDFWKQHWVSRMEEALENLKGAADRDQDIKSAEEMGVVWDDERELTGYAFWTNHIDEIMKHARKSLKLKNG